MLVRPSEHPAEGESDVGGVAVAVAKNLSKVRSSPAMPKLQLDVISARSEKTNFGLDQTFFYHFVAIFISLFNDNQRFGPFSLKQSYILNVCI